MKYKVCFYEDGLYEVINLQTSEIEFRGSLADCEAWIRLTTEGYI